MRRAVVLAGLCLMLGGCPAPRDINNNSLAPLPTPTAAPVPWLSLDPVCTGSITRAEWLVCDNAQLNALHRRLAQQWATARQYASDEKYGVLEDQLYALLSERDQCQDAVCVATAYRRYIEGPVPTVRPTPKPRPTYKPTRRPGHGKPWHGGQGQGPGWPGPGRDNDGPSCVATAGSQEALRLSRRCARVNPGNGWVCSPQRGCGALKRNIVKGCNETYRKPDFCPKI